MKSTSDNIEFSIVIPCLNEARTIGIVVAKAQESINRLELRGEVIVADNGSTDNSRQIADSAGARVITIEKQGYGAALIGGIQAASGIYVIIGDADDSYDFSKIDEFVEKLRAGYDLVMGTRLKGTILSGAMPFLHQYIGNPLLTWLGNRLLGANVSDYHCGLRGFNRERMNALNLHTAGMEFASEMVAKSALHKLSITEVPIVYHPDGRGRRSHLRTWRDGWRHLKFLLMMSPLWVYFLPGIVLTICGIGTLIVFGTQQDIMSGSEAVIAAVLIILGLQVLNIGVMSRVFSIKVNLLPSSPFWDRFIHIAGFDTGLILSGILAAIASGIFVSNWNSLQPQEFIISFILLTLAVQIISTTFTISMLKVHDRFD